MPITHLFPVPFYFDSVSPDNFSILQTELLTAFEKIEKENKFQKLDKNYPVGNPHKVSDITFRQNIIDDYSLDIFGKELDFHINSYANALNVRTEYKIKSCWFTKTNRGESTNTHTHGESDISGVYYVQTNGEDGDLFLNHPLQLMTASFCFKGAMPPPVVRVKPMPGKILLFPAWVEHGVYINNTDSERISISFNISFARY